MNKLVFEDTLKEISVEDSGCARIAELSNEDSYVFVRLQSWDEDCKHPEFMEFYGKKVRITIEALDEITKLEDHDDIREGMKLRCISEEYEGNVIKVDGVLQTNCCGFGYEPISNLNLDDIELIK